jgi:hypothetical protein
LKSFLATVLPIVQPLVGKLTRRTSTGDARQASGSEYAGNIDYMRRLAVGDEHHTVTLMLLGPELNAGRLLAPVLAVQVMLAVLWWLGCPSTTPSPTATPCGSS